MNTSTAHRKHASFYDNYSYSEGLLKEINDCDFWFSEKIWVNIFVIIHKGSKYNFMKKGETWHMANFIFSILYCFYWAIYLLTIVYLFAFFSMLTSSYTNTIC